MSDLIVPFTSLLWRRTLIFEFFRQIDEYRSLTYITAKERKSLLKRTAAQSTSKA